ncbi:hypothetical protein Hypma_000015 [Hypsizygus marmoreus]|uniref:Uncharacterized protein n=1 Tax=Hypsizygus marmoreus TaxID=39966 RepID=A0A369KBU8_HYPMA|nr:hypothetical protein Hypma_000015 [Hypsizygus marmoreus]
MRLRETDPESMSRGSDPKSSSKEESKTKTSKKAQKERLEGSSPKLPNEIDSGSFVVSEPSHINLDSGMDFGLSALSTAGCAHPPPILDQQNRLFDIRFIGML